MPQTMQTTQDFVKIKITKCSPGEKYHDLVGEHGMARSVPSNDYYRIRHDDFPFIRKSDAVICNDLGRNF